MQYLKDILLKDLTPAQLKEVDAGVKALIEYSEKQDNENRKQSEELHGRSREF